MDTLAMMLQVSDFAIPTQLFVELDSVIPIKIFALVHVQGQLLSVISDLEMIVF